MYEAASSFTTLSVSSFDASGLTHSATFFGKQLLMWRDTADLLQCISSAATVKSTTAAHPIFLSYEQPTILQQQSYTGPFVGSIHSNVNHYPWCYEAKKILQQNLITFATLGDACAAGYRPCEVCNPPACGSQTAMMTLTPTITPMAMMTLTPTIAPKRASTSTANVVQASVARTS